MLAGTLSLTVVQPQSVWRPWLQVCRQSSLLSTDFDSTCQKHSYGALVADLRARLSTRALIIQPTQLTRASSMDYSSGRHLLQTASSQDTAPFFGFIGAAAALVRLTTSQPTAVCLQAPLLCGPIIAIMLSTILLYAIQVFSCMGAAYGTAKSGVGIASMGVMRPELVIKSIVPVVMAGVLGIYGLIIAVIISTGGRQQEVVVWGCFRRSAVALADPFHQS